MLEAGQCGRTYKTTTTSLDNAKRTQLSLLSSVGIESNVLSVCDQASQGTEYDDALEPAVERSHVAGVPTCMRLEQLRATRWLPP